MACRARHYCQRHGTGGIPRQRQDPKHPFSRHSDHLSPQTGRNNFFPSISLPESHYLATDPRLPSTRLTSQPRDGRHDTTDKPPTPQQGQGPDLPYRADDIFLATANPITLDAPQGGYTSAQLLPELHSMPSLSGSAISLPPSRAGFPPVPHPWTPKFIPENWTYTDGSDIKGYPRLGAAVVHIPTSTTIFIDAAGTEETRTIMRAELVAIHTALISFADHEWIGLFTDSLSGLQAIRHRHDHTGVRSARDYHHHRLS